MQIFKVSIIDGQYPEGYDKQAAEACGRYSEVITSWAGEPFQVVAVNDELAEKYRDIPGIQPITPDEADELVLGGRTVSVPMPEEKSPESPEQELVWGDNSDSEEVKE